MAVDDRCLTVPQKDKCIHISSAWVYTTSSEISGMSQLSSKESIKLKHRGELRTGMLLLKDDIPLHNSEVKLLIQRLYSFLSLFEKCSRFYANSHHYKQITCLGRTKVDILNRIVEQAIVVYK